jgi:hypothetical protein
MYILFCYSLTMTFYVGIKLLLNVKLVPLDYLIIVYMVLHKNEDIFLPRLNYNHIGGIFCPMFFDGDGTNVVHYF